MEHRGPDSFQLKALSHAVLGHARLAIVDLSSNSNQPFSDLTGRWCISWNGEIYNYQELRRQLEDFGYSFSTLSDTEVLLEAYKVWGEACLSRLNGMWALAIFDKRESALFLSRDRYGIKPLYWAESGSELLFASELKAFFHLGIPRDPNWEHLSRYLHEGFVDEAGDATVFKRVHSLPPGHSLSLQLKGSRTISRWWSIQDHLTDSVPDSFEDRIHHFRGLFEDSVRLRARNDVPTAITLSGGVDSSSVYGACCRLRREGKIRYASEPGREKTLRVCSVIFPGHDCDEYPWIEKCLDYWNGRDDFFPVTPPAEVIPLLAEEVIWFQEAPVWSPAIFSLHSLYKNIASEGIRVVLEGHGADEMLGGYSILIKAATKEYIYKGNLWQAWNALRCLENTCGPHAATPAFSLGLILKDAFMRFVAVSGRQKPKYANSTAWVPASTTYQKFFPQEIMNAWSPPEARVVNVRESFKNALYASFTKRALPFFLRVFDRATMAYGIESCTPFLDHRLVQFVFSLPHKDKVSRVSKKILREAGRRWIPGAIVNRRAKVPFTAPIVDWFNSSIVREYLYDTFNSVAALSSSCINGCNIASFVNSKKETDFTHEDVQIVWPVLNLYLWERMF